MGCDIHQKVFVRQRSDGKLVPATSVMSDADAKYFPEIVGDRNYDLFGLFGNCGRSWYPEMGCFELKIPEEVRTSSIVGYIGDSEFHTRRWCGIGNLRKSLSKYRKALVNPEEWKRQFDDEDDFVLDAIEKKSCRKKFVKCHENLVTAIDGVRKAIDETEAFLNRYSDFVNPKEIYLLTWMDS